MVNGVVTLDHVWRFGGAIAAFARAVQAGDADAALELLRAGRHDLRAGPRPTRSTRCGPTSSRPGPRSPRPRRPGEAEEALAALERHRVLCAHRRGPFGVARWSAEVERWLAPDPRRG